MKSKQLSNITPCPNADLSRWPCSLSMHGVNTRYWILFLLSISVLHGEVRASDATPKIPRFSVENMDPSVDPAADFYHFAAGGWLKQNPIPADKSSWGGFAELRERNWFLLHQILDETLADKSAKKSSPRGEVRAFYASAMDTNRLERLAFKAIAADLK